MEIGEFQPLFSFQINLGELGEAEPEIDVWFSSSGSYVFGSIGMFVGEVSM